MKRFMTGVGVAVLLASCSSDVAELERPASEDDAEVMVARVEVTTAPRAVSRAYDEALQWSWAKGDALRGYQVAGDCLHNTLEWSGSGFVCEAFRYMSADDAAFHFIYPAGAEQENGALVAVQNGVWQPLSVATTAATTVDALPSIDFEVLTGALELRIYADEEMTAEQTVTMAQLSSETTDFVGKWMLNEDDMSYTQTLSGKVMTVGLGEPTSTVAFNMPEATFDAGLLTLKLTDAEGGSMTRQLPALNFVKGKRTVVNVVYKADATEGGTEQGGVITGTFTAATYNVDGLPSVINSDGPGSDGTASISQKLASSGWDIITFQENFAYSDDLRSSLTADYTFGTDRGNISYTAALIGKVTDTDGLAFATLNSTCSFSGETWETFTDAYGGLDEGANTLLAKGIRYYLVTFQDGVQIDVIVTHMNSGSDEGHLAARQSQLTQIANYINSIRSNNRPILLLGDTNCRYTRDDFKTYFWDVLDEDLVVADPWVEYSWGGVYPELGTASLMVPSKDSASTLTEQTGEVVDKIIYINNPNAAVQIKADNYMNDTDYAGMADHNPVRATFTYTYHITQ